MDRLDDVTVRTVLFDRDQPISCDIHANVCKKGIRAQCDFCWSAARDLLVDLIVTEMNKVHDVVADRIGAPAVAIDLRSHVEGGRRNVSDRAVGGPGHDVLAALLSGSSLDPVDIVPLNPWLRERSGFGHSHGGCNGGGP